MRGKQEGVCGCMVDPSEGLMPLCDPTSGIFGAEGGGKALGRAAAVKVLASVISSL